MTAPAWMKAPILQTARDAADAGEPLYVDMAVDTDEGQYGVEVTTGFDGEGSWRANQHGAPRSERHLRGPAALRATAFLETRGGGRSRRP